MIAETVEPTHIITFGLVIALGGAVWLSRRAPQPDPRVSQLQAQIEYLQKQLTEPHRAVSSPTQPVPAESKQTYSERDIRELLDKLDDASALLERHIFPATNRITEATANWINLIPNLGVKGSVEKLKEMKASLQTEVWEPINELVYGQTNRHQKEMRKALVLGRVDG
jgi:hypothetical protein